MEVGGLKRCGWWWLQAAVDALDGDVGVVGVVEGRFGDVVEHLVPAAVGRHDGQRKWGHSREGWERVRNNGTGVGQLGGAAWSIVGGGHIG